MQLKIDIGEAAEAEQVKALSLGVFDRSDLANLILQRSEVLYDLPRQGAVIRAWNSGDSSLIEAQVDRLGEEIARRAAGVIHAEYISLRETLQELNPRHLADIGCGYGFFSLFAAQEFGCDVTLIDLETNDQRHFGFEDEAAAYSSLSVAKKLFVDNGVAEARLACVNPSQTDVLTLKRPDLAISFLSCGFHYPVDSYVEFFEKTVTDDGAVLLDLRESNALGQLMKLTPMGRIEDLDAPPKVLRILLRKGGAA
ncbi:SAM-dependent methyltransferase [Albirhodobacter sp. R86504]|uniref:SAM-dependent methyltransferase n=1 Tax=Albirhodobacter sp. R86504 TaxID=3093848 RepID=UPI0036734523